MKTIPLSEATRDQLANHASVNLGLEIKDTDTKDAIMTAIAKSGITVTTLDVADEKPRAPRKVEKAEASAVIEHERDLVGLPVTILINQVDGENDMEFVGVNGTGMYVQRGIPQTVKYEYYAVLRNAKKTVYAQTEQDGLGEARTIPGLPIQVLEMDPRISGWLARNAA